VAVTLIVNADNQGIGIGVQLHGAANIESREAVGEASPRRFTKPV